MTYSRSLVTVPVVAGVTAWLMASSGTTPAAPAPPTSTRAELDAARADEIVAHAARLRSRLAAMPARPGATRNPFRFESRTRHSAEHVVRTAAPQSRQGPGDDAAAAPVVRPELRLIGMAEDTTNGETLRTAVVAGLNQVYLVHEGEQIAMRFLVKRIGVDAIEIEDLADSTPLRLGLP